MLLALQFIADFRFMHVGLLRHLDQVQRCLVRGCLIEFQQNECNALGWNGGYRATARRCLNSVRSPGYVFPADHLPEA